MRIADRMNRIPESQTMAITMKAMDMKARGIDVIGFGAGEPARNSGGITIWNMNRPISWFLLVGNILFTIFFTSCSRKGMKSSSRHLTGSLIHLWLSWLKLHLSSFPPQRKAGSKSPRKHCRRPLPQGHGAWSSIAHAIQPGLLIPEPNWSASWR